MILAINNSKTLADLQEKFNECFPHLKIEFYTHSHHWKATSPQREQLDLAKTVGEVSKKNENGMLDIKSWYQIGKVEQDFHRLFGLNVQIFRNERGTWMQTSESDSLLLKEQPPVSNKQTTYSIQDSGELEESFLENE